LAKAELKEKVQAVAKQAGFFGAAGILGYTGLLILLPALILGIIALGVVAWLATLAVGIVVMLGTFLLVQRARHIGKSSPQCRSSSAAIMAGAMRASRPPRSPRTFGTRGI